MSLHQLEALQWLIFLVFCDLGMSSTTVTTVYKLTGSSLELSTVTLSSGFKPSSTSSTGPSCSSQLTSTSTDFEFTTAHSTPLLTSMAISSFAPSSLISTFHSSGTELNGVKSTPVSSSSRPSSVTTTYVRCSPTIATQLVLMSETVPTTSIGTISSSLVAEYSVAKSTSSISYSVSSAQSNTASIIHPFTKDLGMSSSSVSSSVTTVYELTGSLELSTVTSSSGFKPSCTSSTGRSSSLQLTPTSTAHSTPLLTVMAISSFVSSSFISTLHSSSTELNGVISTPVSGSSRTSSVTTTYVRCSPTIATQLVLMSETVPTISIGTISSSLVTEYSVAKSTSSISDSVSTAKSNTASITYPFTKGRFTPSFTLEPSTTMGISPTSSYKGNHAQSIHVTLSSAIVSATASSTVIFHPITPMLSSTANTATTRSSMIPSTENRAISSSTPLKPLITSTINYNPKTPALDSFATISKSSSYIVTASTSNSSLFSSNTESYSVITLVPSSVLEPSTTVSAPSNFIATDSSSTTGSIIGNSITRSAALSPSIKPYEMESFSTNVTMDVRSAAIFTSTLISAINSLPTSTLFTPTSSRIVSISLSTHETLNFSSATKSTPVRATVTENVFSTSRTTMSKTAPRRSPTTIGPSTHKRTTCYDTTCLGDGCLKTLIQSQDVGFCLTNASCHIRRAVNKTYHQESASCFENTVPCDWTLFTTETIVETSDCCKTDRCNTIDLLFSSAERLLPTAVMVLWVIVRVL